MKKIILLASIFLCSFTGNAATDPLGNFISTLPLQKATSQIEIKKSDPGYIQELKTLNPEQKKVLEYALRVGNDYDIKTAKPVEKKKTKRLGYHLAAIAWIESRACEDTGKGKRGHHAVGCWQVLYSTANKRTNGNVSKQKLKNYLNTLEGGSKFAIYELEYWLNYHNGDLKRALASYNAGFKFKSPHAQKYANMVMNTASILKEKQIL